MFDYSFFWAYLVTVLKALFRIYQLIILANPVLWVKLGWIGFAYDRNFLELKKYTNFYYLYTYFQQWRHSRRHYPNGKSWYPMYSRCNCSNTWFQWLHYCKLQVHSSILIFLIIHLVIGQVWGFLLFYQKKWAWFVKHKTFAFEFVKLFNDRGCFQLLFEKL